MEKKYKRLFGCIMFILLYWVVIPLLIVSAFQDKFGVEMWVENEFVLKLAAVGYFLLGNTIFWVAGELDSINEKLSEKEV